MQRRLPKLWRRTRRCSHCTLMVASSVSEQRGMGCVSTHHPLSSEEHPGVTPDDLSDRMIPPSLFLLTHYHRVRCARLSLASRGERPAAPSPPPPPFLSSSFPLFPPSIPPPLLWLRSSCLTCLVTRCSRSACQLCPRQPDGVLFAKALERNATLQSLRLYG